MVAIAGSKFKGSNSRDRNYTASKIDKRQQQIEGSRKAAVRNTASRWKRECLDPSADYCRVHQILSHDGRPLLQAALRSLPIRRII